MNCRHCDKRAVAKGMCKPHYNEAYKRALRVRHQFHVNCMGERLVVPVPVPGWGYRA